jgi:hypothetical protein
MLASIARRCDVLGARSRILATEHRRFYEREQRELPPSCAMRKCRKIDLPLIPAMPAAHGPIGIFSRETVGALFFRQPFAPIFLAAGAIRLWR